MVAIIFWIVIICAVLFTIGFMACAVGEYVSNDIEKRVSLNEWKKRFILADIIPVICIVLFWII